MRKNSICDKNFDFWPSFRCLPKIFDFVKSLKKKSILIKIVDFSKFFFDFWPNFLFILTNIRFSNKFKKISDFSISTLKLFLFELFLLVFFYVFFYFFLNFFLGTCLTMHQPWASLLIKGIKIHEGRVWNSSHRGRLWIHSSSKEPDPEMIKVEIENHKDAVFF